MTFFIVDPWQSCVCFIRSGVTRCTLLMVFYHGSYVAARVTRCARSRFGTLMHRLAADLAVQQDFYSLIGVPLERSFLPRIRRCGTGEFQEQGQCFFIGPSCSIPTIVFYSFSLSLLSVYRLVLLGWGLRTDRVYITLSRPCTADLF